MQLTTFHGLSVDERFPLPKHHWKWAKYLPVYPREPLVCGGVQLRLANGVEIRPGYVSIGHIYTVHISMLRKYDWEFPADHYRLCEQSLADVLNSIHHHHAGLEIMVEAASHIGTPSSMATLRQEGMGSSIYTTEQATLIDIDGLYGQCTNYYPESPSTHHEIETVGRISSGHTPLLSQQHIQCSYQTLSQQTRYNESVIRTYVRADRSSRTILDFSSSIARNTGLMLFWVLKPSLHFLRRNYGVILFLLAAGAVGIGAVLGTIWFINVLYRSTVVAGHWVAGEWQLLLNAGGKVYAAVAQFIHAVVQAVKHGWHAFVS